MTNQPYILKKQIISLIIICIAEIIAILEKSSKDVYLFLLSFFVVLLFVTFSPIILRRFKLPESIHSFFYYMGFYIFGLYYINREIYVSYDLVVLGEAIFLIIIMLFFNRKEYKKSINGIYSQIPISYVEYLNLLISHVLAIISEEIYFRYFIIDLGHERNEITIIFFSASIFVLVHYLNRWANVMFTKKNYFFIFLLGLILGWIYYKTNSIVYCIFLHAIYNSSDLILLTKKVIVKNTKTNNLFDDY